DASTTAATGVGGSAAAAGAANTSRSGTAKRMKSLRTRRFTTKAQRRRNTKKTKRKCKKNALLFIFLLVFLVPLLLGALCAFVVNPPSSVRQEGVGDRRVAGVGDFDHEHARPLRH